VPRNVWRLALECTVLCDDAVDRGRLRRAGPADRERVRGRIGGGSRCGLVGGGWCPGSDEDPSEDVDPRGAERKEGRGRECSSLKGEQLVADSSSTGEFFVSREARLPLAELEPKGCGAARWLKFWVLYHVCVRGRVPSNLASWCSR